MESLFLLVLQEWVGFLQVEMTRRGFQEREVYAKIQEKNRGMKNEDKICIKGKG